MTKTPQAGDIFYLGIDGGGTSCRALLVNAEFETLGSAVAGSANVFQDIDQAKASVLEASKKAVAEAGLEAEQLQQVVAGVALAGLHSPQLFDVMLRWEHPYRELFLTNDLHGACLGAHEGGDGAVVIVGTGSCAYVSVKGRNKTYGAHGFPHGDKGSGAWIGLEAIKAILLASDGLGPQTLMSELLYRDTGARDHFIVDHFIQASSRHYARVAKLVFEAAGEGDEVAIGIMREGADYLNGLFERILEEHPPRVSLMGGLSEFILPWLKPGIEDLLSPPLGSAEVGAIIFARQQFSGEAFSVA